MGGPAMIDGEIHHEVDNFLPVDFTIDGVQYPSVENWFQCSKTTDPVEREKIRGVGSGQDVWRAGAGIQALRKDWEAVKVRIMYQGHKAKFEQHPHLAKKLTATDGPIIFNPSPQAPFWPKWNAHIMELLREELKPGGGNLTRVKALRADMEAYEQNAKK